MVVGTVFAVSYKGLRLKKGREKDSYCKWIIKTYRMLLKRLTGKLKGRLSAVSMDLR